MHRLSDSAWSDMSGIWHLHQYKRKTILTAAGETERHVYFVLSGVQRIFYIDAHHEATLVFTYPYSFSGIADSFLTQLPSRYFLETLTASTLLRTTHTQIQQLMDKHRDIEKLIANFTSFALMGVLQLLHKARGVNINRLRIPVSIAPFIKLKMGDVFGFIIAHHQRHFVQIENIIIPHGV